MSPHNNADSSDIPVERKNLLVGMIGHGIQQSLAPELHMMEGDALGIRYIYRRIDLELIGKGNDDLPALLNAARTFGYDGLVITHPCKQAVIPFLTRVSETADVLQAVNTVVFRAADCFGYNTDWSGFLSAFRSNLADVPVGDVVLLGCGGAGAAVAYAILRHGARRLTIFEPDAARAEELACRLGSRFPGQSVVTGRNIEKAVASADGLINATPVGMKHSPGTPLPVSLLRPDLWVADIIYFPEETELLAAARRLGARTMNGRAMSAFQVAEQIELFSGLVGDPKRILEFSDLLANSRKGR